MDQQQLDQSNKRTAGKLVLVVFAMFGFGFALVPLYGLMCDAFGLNGRFVDIANGEYGSQQGKEAAQSIVGRKDMSRSVTVQFMTALNQNMNWEFRPLVKKISLHPGEVKQVRFYAKNLTDKTVVGQAVPSLAPGQAVKYFTKMECFCFSQQTFKPGEAREMPLIFVVAPDLPKNISTITLAYTFFDTKQNENKTATFEVEEKPNKTLTKTLITKSTKKEG